ncbi:MAG: ASPIC/UnbV domain-containing protein [Myxococcota bacterium]
MALSEKTMVDAPSGFSPTADDADQSFSGWEPKKLWLRTDGGVEECAWTEGFDTRADGRSLFAGDLDGDGDVDLLLLNRNAPRLQLFENRGPRGHAVRLRFVPAAGHRDADGTRVQVNGRAEQVLLARGFSTVVAPELVRGLGAATHADVVVTWRSGQRTTHRVPADATSTLYEKGGRTESTPFRTSAPPPPPRFPTTAEALGLPAGKRLVVPLFLAGCEPCRKEAPVLNRLAALGAVGVVGLGAVKDGEDARAVAKALGYRFEVRALPDWAGDALATNGQLTFPLALVFGAGGGLERVVTDVAQLPP